MKRYMAHNKQIPMDTRIMRARTDTPYITWISEGSAWRVQLSKPIDGEKHLNKRFCIASYGGSSAKALAAAIAYRDANVCEKRLQSIRNREACKAEEGDIEEPVDQNTKYKPRLFTQWQLWHQKKMP